MTAIASGLDASLDSVASELLEAIAGELAGVGIAHLHDQAGQAITTHGLLFAVADFAVWCTSPKVHNGGRILNTTNALAYILDACPTHYRDADGRIRRHAGAP